MKTKWKIGLVLILLFMAGWRLWGARGRVGFYVDEQYYLRRTNMVDLYIQGDFDNKVWQSWEAYNQPLLGSLMYGVVLKLQGIKNLTKYLNEHGYRWYEHDYGAEKYWWASGGEIHTEGDLNNLSGKLVDYMEPVLMARKLAVLMILATIAMVVMVGWEMGNFWTGWLSGLVLVLNKFFVRNGVRVMTEAPLVFFMLLGFWLTYRWAFSLRTGRGKKKFVWMTLLLGLVLGLGMAAKFTMLINVGLVSGVVIIRYFEAMGRSKKGWVERMEEGSLWVGSLMLMGVIGFVIFVLLNPYVWGRPIFRSLEMVVMRSWALETVVDNNMGDAVLTGMDKVVQVVEGLYGGWGRGVGMWLVAVVSVVGIGLMAIRREREDWVLWLWLAVGFWLVIKFITVQWMRYYFPLYPMVVLISVSGWVKGVRWLRDIVVN